MIIDRQAATPLQHLAALDLLDDNTVLIHAVWLNDHDMEILADSGAHVVSCPQSNAKLASGIANIPQMLEKNITVGLGTDGCASNNGLDMFREMDMLAKIHKLDSLDATTLPAQQVIRTVTSANAELLGLPDLGSLAVGNPADLILLDLQTPNLTPFYSPDLLVYSGCGGNVHSTMINGQMVMENRKILSFDLDETLCRVREMSTPNLP